MDRLAYVRLVAAALEALDPEYRRLYVTCPEFRAGVDRFLEDFLPAVLNGLAIQARKLQDEEDDRVP